MSMYTLKEKDYEQIKEDVKNLIDECFEYLDVIKNDKRSKRIASLVGGYILDDFTDREWFAFLLGLHNGMEMAEECK